MSAKESAKPDASGSRFRASKGSGPGRAGRVPSETGRVPSETGRVPSETGRVPSETGLVPSETGLVRYERVVVPFGKYKRHTVGYIADRDVLYLDWLLGMLESNRNLHDPLTRAVMEVCADRSAEIDLAMQGRE